MISLYQEADQAGFKPQIDPEWLPLIEAYIKTGDLNKAYLQSKTIIIHDIHNTAGFCELWKNQTNNEKEFSLSTDIISWLECEKEYE